jgi:predicted nucleic acid-binding protein
MTDNDTLEYAKRDAVIRALARRIHSDLRHQFNVLEDDFIYSHCWAAATALIDGLVVAASTKATGAFDSDIGFRYRMNIK